MQVSFTPDRMSRFGRNLGLIFAAVLGCALAGSQRSVSAQDSPVITIAGPANDSGAEFFYANDLGMFKKAGLNVQIQVVNNAGTISSAVSSGAVTVGSLTVPIVALAYDKGIPLRILAPAAVYTSDPPTSGMIVLNDSPYHKAADLNGKTVGVRDISNMNYYGARIWLDEHGGDSSTVHFVEIPEPQAVALMQSGRIDSADLSEPAFSNGMHNGARLFAPVYDAIGKHFLVGVYFVTDAYARAHPDIVKRLFDVIVDAGKWANTHRDESAKILEKYTGSPLAPDIPRVTYAEDLRTADVQPVLDVLFKFGALKKATRAADIFAPGVPWK